MKSVAVSKKTVIIGYICSCCGSPILSTLKVKAKVQQRFVRLWNLEKKEQETRFSAQKAVLEMIRKIEQCKNICTSADVELRKRSILSFSSFCDMAVREFGGPCPNCMNCEPWVPANLSKNDLLDLKEENFPTVFESYEDAEKWALETNVAIIKQTEQVRLSREAVEQAAKGAERYRGIIGELKEQKAALPELSQERRLLEEKKVCLCERERLGVLKFKERKALKEKSRAIEYRLTKKEQTSGKSSIRSICRFGSTERIWKRCWLWRTAVQEKLLEENLIIVFPFIWGLRRNKKTAVPRQRTLEEGKKVPH